MHAQPTSLVSPPGQGEDRHARLRRQGLLLVTAAVLGVFLMARALHVGASLEQDGSETQSLTSRVGRQARLLVAQLPACQLRRLTGIACPTCQSTRAVMSAASLDFPRALALNALVTLALSGILALGGVSLVAPQVADRVLVRASRFLRTGWGRVLAVLLLIAQAVSITVSPL